MRTNHFILSLLLVCFVSSPASASLITFATRGAFDAAAPGLSVEDFEDATDLAGPYAFPNTLDSTTSNVNFSPGDVLPGLSIEATDPLAEHVNDLSWITPSWGLGTSQFVAANFFVETLNLNFANTSAVGMDVYSIFSGSTVTVSIFGDGDAFLGSFDVLAPSSGAGAFFGVVNDSGLIRRIHLSSGSGEAEGADNIAFSPAGAVPEPVTLLLLGTGVAGSAYRRRRKA